MKFSFIVLVMILKFASPNNPKSINVNVKTAFEFEPKNNKQNIQIIDDIQQFLSQLRSALDRDHNVGLRNNKGFNICSYIKAILNEVAKYDNYDLESFFLALRSHIKSRYNTADFKQIFYDKSVRSYIKKTFAELNRTSANEKRAMLKFGAMAMNAEPMVLTQFNEFFGENDKTLFEKHIEDINKVRHAPKLGKKFKDLVKNLTKFLIFDRYAKLDQINKSKVNKLINGYDASLNDLFLRTINGNHKQRDFLLSNNLQIAVKALSKANNKQFNIQIEPIPNKKEQPTEVTELETNKVNKTGKSSHNINTKSIEFHKDTVRFKADTKSHQQKENDEKLEHIIQHKTPMFEEKDDIIEKDIKNLLNYNVNDDGNKSKTRTKTTKQINNENTKTKNDIKKKLKVITVHSENSGESQEITQHIKNMNDDGNKSKARIKTTKQINNENTKRKNDIKKKLKVITVHSENSGESQEITKHIKIIQKHTKKTTKKDKNDSDSDSDSEKKIESADENTDNNDILEIITKTTQSLDFTANERVGNSENDDSKADETNSKTSKESAKKVVEEYDSKTVKESPKIQEMNLQTSKEKKIKEDMKNDDDNSNFEKKSKENSQEIMNQKAFEQAELSFRVLETKFNHRKSKGDDLAIVKPLPKEAFKKINRDLGLK